MASKISAHNQQGWKKTQCTDTSRLTLQFIWITEHAKLDGGKQITLMYYIWAYITYTLQISVQYIEPGLGHLCASRWPGKYQCLSISRHRPVSKVRLFPSNYLWLSMILCNMFGPDDFIWNNHIDLMKSCTLWISYTCILVAVAWQCCWVTLL